MAEEPKTFLIVIVKIEFRTFPFGDQTFWYPENPVILSSRLPHLSPLYHYRKIDNQVNN